MIPVLFSHNFSQLSSRQQKINQSFQITVQESYDPSYGVAAGAGLSLSGLNLVYGAKKGYVPLAAAVSTG